MIVFDPTFYDPAKAVTVDPQDRHRSSPGSGDRYNGMVIPGTGLPDSAKGRFPEADDPHVRLPVPRRANPPLLGHPVGTSSSRASASPTSSTPKTVIRAGGGRFFTRLGVSDSIFLGGNPPFQPTANVSFGNVDNPGGTSTNLLPLTVTTQSKAFKNPESWNWNFTVERRVLLEVRVAASAMWARRGLHLQREANINQPTAGDDAGEPRREPGCAASLQGLQLDSRDRQRRQLACTTRSR